MGKKMVSDIRNGEPVDDAFLLAGCELKTAKTGGQYLAVRLCDRTGSIEGRMWDASQALYESLETDTFVRVKGTAETYRNQLQLSIKFIAPADTAGLRLGDFLPQSSRSPKEMVAELEQALSVVEDPDFRRLRDAFLQDKDFLAAFRTAPAAVSYHQAYLGGLLEHTLNMLHLAELVIPRYPALRRDVMLMSVFLHDIGKTRELRYNRTFAYTDSGQLVGHLVLGVLMLDEKARLLADFPPEKLDLLRHAILSHHGSYEYGSPRLPMTAEALALHFLDNLDAKLHDFGACVEEDVQTRSNWTEFKSQFQRRLYKK